MTSKISVLACISSLLLLAGCSSRTHRPADIEYDHSISPYHRVGKGESISSIAQKFGMDKMELVRLNGLKPPYKIFVGQKLLVKTAATSAKHVEDSFDAPAASSTEMKGDVEVTTLEPIKGTEPAAQDQLPSESLNDTETIDASADHDLEGEGIDAEKPATAGKTKVKASIPHSAGLYSWPVKGKIVKGFKPGKTGNDGINISAPKGTPVKSANNGVVAHTGNQVAGLGNIILIKHTNGYMTVYTHLDDIKVTKGQQVSAGDKIGTVGKTGNVKEPQLHFEIRNGKTPIDPNEYLN
ncbi:M23 family metallopeptidase [Candidatus Paracaedibacter symbiosus]|uniref:M23 family metallopeptidase n=1 Tax=Candidatus Paracaedibacter symbiosus TaxID=244582 RepID=UPI0018DCB8C1|nr:M23 family metallopeptidase [Candidatus Paracaedibacter symbiosus]